MNVLGCKTRDELLARLRTALQKKDLGEVARECGYRSKASVSMFLSGKRPITRRARASLGRYFGWSRLESAHVEELLQEHAQSQRDGSQRLGREVESMRLTMTGPTSAAKHFIDKQIVLNPKQFSLMAKWYRLPLLLLLDGLGKFPGYGYLERKLRHKVTFEQLLESLYALERLGFVKRHGKKLQILLEPYTVFSSKSPSVDVQNFHWQMLGRAQEAIREQPMEARLLRGLTFSISPTRFAEAKTAISEFVEVFNQRFTDPAATEVAQLNIQLFWHTDTGVGKSS